MIFGDAMKRFCLVVGLTLLVLLGREARASTPHYINGILGIQAATMPPPGMYYTMFNTNYYANSVRNNNGDKIVKCPDPTCGNDVDFKLDAYLQIHNLTYSSDFKIFGGRWLADIDIPLIYSDMSLSDAFHIPLPNYYIDKHIAVNDNSFGLSDLYIEPLVLAWNLDRVDFTVMGGVFAPTGRFDQNDPTSQGRGFWTFKGGAGATVYFDEAKTWTASILAGYEVHTKQKETDVTPGDHFHFEWGVGKRFAKYFVAGAAGYCSWQVKKDKGPGASPHLTRSFAAGPELGVIIPSWKAELAVRSLWEFENRNAPQGNLTTVTLNFAF